MLHAPAAALTLWQSHVATNAGTISPQIP